MAPARGKVAFVAGANGITGNAIIEHLIRKPESECSIALDFLNLVELIQRTAALCHDVTHAFFTSYVHIADSAKLRDCNVPLLHKFLVAIDTVAASKLQRACLQTGGKVSKGHSTVSHCGLAIVSSIMVPTLDLLKSLFTKEMGRYEDKGENFYYSQEDFLCTLAAKHSWNRNVIRPNAIIGYTPADMIMGVPPIFPGNKFFFDQCVDYSSYAPSIADPSDWAVTDKHTENEALNHQNSYVFVWKQLYGRLGRYFGIGDPELTEWAAKGNRERMAKNFLMIEWRKGKKQVWERVLARYGGQLEAFEPGTWDFFDWARYDDTYDTYVETFRAFGQATQVSLAPPPYDAVTLMKAKVNKEQNGVATNGVSHDELKNGLENEFQKGHFENEDLAVKI
ncbi:hypothetical protein FSPOR_7579 [Fusarium sporotrichioides]|uniref:PRISE-like Rossmann-fold domain-containing protein n=1 Tax=Fusarium sporotrichioides TaxID=5514 RepID=A0A395RY40_FUSSP|nr:hypothetical protein FSPOR_7579 [Fusarium sporotrichioides]